MIYKHLSLSFVVACMLAALSMTATARALEVPQLSARVTDLAGVLSAAERDSIDAKLKAYETKTGHQFAVLIVPSLEGGVLEFYAVTVFERWKLGDKGRDDGLLFLVAIKDRKMRIEVGYGLEGAVPDALAARIIEGWVTPRFREGRFAAGIDEGLTQLMKAAEHESIGKPPRDNASLPVALLVLLMVLFPFLVVILIIKRVAGFAGGGQRSFRWGSSYGSSGWSSGSSWSSGGGFGGFSGGGGSSGGGGASGSW